MKYKEYIKNIFIGKKVHFKSDCIVNIDISGIVVDAEYAGPEIIYIVDTGRNVVKVGENMSELQFEFIK